MRNTLKLFFSLLMIFILGCSKNSSEGESSASEGKDGEMSLEIKGLTENFKKINDGEAFKLDEAFMRNWTEMDTVTTSTILDREQINLLTQRMAKFSLNQSISWLITDLYRIDSLKKNNKYEAYKDGLDIGQTLDVFANATNRVKLSDSVELLIWHIHYTTIEACPYATGEYFFGTILFKNQIGETLLMAQNMRASDAPVGMSEIHESTIKPNGSIKIMAESINTEEGMPDEKSNKTFQFQMDKMSFQKLSS